MNAPMTSHWPESLDALAAAPKYHRLLLENESVRVLEVVIPSGSFVPVHTHRWPGVQYILSSSDFIRRGPDGKVQLDTRELASPIPPVVWSAPLAPHSVENIGDGEIRVIVVEVKPNA
jgi:hypothetical protein